MCLAERAKDTQQHTGNPLATVIAPCMNVPLHATDVWCVLTHRVQEALR